MHEILDQDDADDPGEPADEDVRGLTQVLVHHEEEDHDHEGRPGGQVQTRENDLEHDDERHQQEPEQDAATRENLAHALILLSG